jgi:hypothetical protein
MSASLSRAEMAARALTGQTVMRVSASLDTLVRTGRLCASVRSLSRASVFDHKWVCVCACASSETEVRECQSQPCVNGGTCVDQINGFACVCAAGWSGGLCQTDINECSSQPCRNGGTCVDRINGYNCTCAAGLSGPQCQSGVFCLSQPCANGGTCTETSSGHTCLCPRGFSGSSWCVLSASATHNK